MSDRHTAIATRLMPDPYGGFIRVPAYVVAEPRKRGAISDWLKSQRAASPPVGARPSLAKAAGASSGKGSN